MSESRQGKTASSVTAGLTVPPASDSVLGGQSGGPCLTPGCVFEAGHEDEHPCGQRIETLGQRLRRLRLAAGLTQQQLTERLPRTQTALSYWESDKREPGLDDLMILADALGVRTSTLIGEGQDRSADYDDGYRAGYETAMKSVRDLTMKIPTRGKEESHADG